MLTAMRCWCFMKTVKLMTEGSRHSTLENAEAAGGMSHAVP